MARVSFKWGKGQAAAGQRGGFSIACRIAFVAHRLA
jgi:hypothetical protein